MSPPVGSPRSPGTPTPAAAEEWPVVVDTVLDREQSARLYDLYLRAFAPLRNRAAARHVVSAEEFLHQMVDPRVLKYSVWHTPEHPVALGTITSCLDAMPWISPHFYHHRYPSQAARGAIYYVGFGLVEPRVRQYKVLERVVREMVAPCAEARGVLAYDVCHFNDEVVRFGRRAEAGLRRMAPVRVEVADVQTYYGAVFE